MTVLAVFFDLMGNSASTLNNWVGSTVRYEKGEKTHIAVIQGIASGSDMLNAMSSGIDGYDSSIKNRLGKISNIANAGVVILKIIGKENLTWGDAATLGITAISLIGKFTPLGMLGTALNFGLNAFALYDNLSDFAKLNRTGKYQVYDPLSLDLDGDGIETTAIEGLNSTLFDHNKDGIRTATGWVSADDGLLVLDRNGDGVINHGGELFGDNTLLKDGSLAANGFAALAEFDENGDGKIDAQDAVFHQLKVWRDLNQDGISQEGELFTLEQLGIQSLDLNHQAVNQRQDNGNSVARLGSYTDSEGKEHLIGDLLFDSNPMISRFSDEVELSAA